MGQAPGTWPADNNRTVYVLPDLGAHSGPGGIIHLCNTSLLLAEGSNFFFFFLSFFKESRRREGGGERQIDRHQGVHRLIASCMHPDRG